jgi:dipeptidyl aminopeptidase/acylaminoacyl peptidase
MRRRVGPVVAVLSFLLLCAAAGAAPKPGLTPDDFYQLRTITEPALSPDGKLVAFVVNAMDRAQNRRVSSIWIAAADGATPPREFTTEHSSRSPRWSPDGLALAFLSARADPDPAPSSPLPKAQVLLLSLKAGGEARRLTSLKDGVEAFEWSPDGTRIACVSKMAAGDAVPAARSDVRHYRHAYYKEDGSGYDDGRRGQLWVVEVESGAAKQVTSDEARSVSGPPAWSPDGKAVAFVAQRLDADTEENADAWVVAASGGAPTKISDTGFRVAAPTWSPDGTRIAYIAAQDWEAIPKIRLVDAGGGKSSILAPALTFMTDIGWSADGRALYAQVPVKGEEHLVRVEAAAGTWKTLAGEGRAVRRADVNEAAGMVAFVANDASHPDELFVEGIDGRGERRLTHFHDALVAGKDLPGVERLSWKSVDGWGIEGFLMKPAGWSTGRSWPMVLNIHGGPNGMYGVQWNADFQALAGAGYAVFYTNPRGSSGYGESFQRGVAGEWGGKAYEDIVRGVDAVLAGHAWIDRERLGVTGQSYGGFMTDWIVGHTTRFKAAVSLSGISDFVSVEGTRDGFYGHAKDFGGDLFDSFPAYWAYSPVQFAGRVETPTLLLHGDADHRVPLLQGEEFFRALRHFGVVSELVIFPREPHSLRREPRHQVEVMDWTLYWFDRFLLGKQDAKRPNGR